MTINIIIMYYNELNYILIKNLLKNSGLKKIQLTLLNDILNSTTFFDICKL